MNILSVPITKRSIRQPARSGFTLVELLLVVAIIAILSTLAVGMLRTAQLEARESATEARISQIEKIVSIYIEDMEFRKLPIRVASCCNTSSGMRGIATNMQRLRSQLLVDYLNVEIPNEDVVLGVFPSDDFWTWANGNGNVYVNLNTNLTHNRLDSALIRRWANANNAIDLPGERLWLLLSMIEFEGESALESLGGGAIGDSDGDGQMELIDAWGNPLQYELQQQNPNNLQWEPIDLTADQNLTDLRFKAWSYESPWRKDL